MRCPFCLNEISEFKVELDANRRPVLVCPDSACAEQGVPQLYADDFDDFPLVPFSLIGLRGHGKTVFLTSLLDELDRVGLRWPDFYSAPLDEESFREVHQRLIDIRGGKLPEASRMVFPRAELLRLQHIPRVGGCHLAMFDTSGEAFQTVNGIITYARYVRRSSAVIWLISLDNIESPSELDQVLTVYLQALAEMRSDAAKQELIVVLTKGDLLLHGDKFPVLPDRAFEMLQEHQLDPRTDSWQRLEQLSRELHDWMIKAGFHQFVNRSDDSFAAVRYCIVSAQGSDAANGQLVESLNPCAVLAPLFWLWRQLAPAVWVDVPGERGLQLFLSLEEAVEESPDDSTLYLEARSYHLPRSLQIRKGLTIKGRGLGKTVVRGSAEGYDLGFGANGGRLEIEGIHFQHDGTKPADVFRAVRGELIVRRCAFSGGESSEKDVAGDGLILARDVRGEVTECVFTRNQGSGATLRDSAQVRLQDCKFQENLSSGLQCHSDAQPELIGNIISNNGAHGIRLGSATLAKVEGNICRNNQRAGISCNDSAQPELRGNQCLVNGLSGIQIRNISHPVVAANRCAENRASGISFTDSAHGKVVDNECEENAHCGIAIADQARPELIDNQCHRNGQHGIGYTGSGGGVARTSRCFANSGCGINVEGDATPTLEDNECSGNASHGICVASTVGKMRVRGTTGRDNRGELVRDFRKRGWFG